MIPNFNKALLRMHFLSNLLRRDLIKNFNRTLNTYNVIEKGQLPKVDENCHYQMKVAVNDNGHVKVKTAFKEPGKDWNVSFEEYDKEGTPFLEQEKTQKKPEALEGKESAKTLKASSKKTEDMKKETEIAEKGKGDQAQADLASKMESPFKEIQSVFDNIEKDFENSLKKNFDIFEENSQDLLTKSSESSLSEIDAFFEKMERDFENTFKKSFGFYDPLFGKGLSEETQAGIEGKSAEEGKAGEAKLEKEGAKQATS